MEDLKTIHANHADFHTRKDTRPYLECNIAKGCIYSVQFLFRLTGKDFECPVKYLAQIPELSFH